MDAYVFACAEPRRGYQSPRSCSDRCFEMCDYNAGAGFYTLIRMIVQQLFFLGGASIQSIFVTSTILFKLALKITASL